MLINKNDVNGKLVEGRGNGNGDFSTDLGTRLDRVNDEIATAPSGLQQTPLTASGTARTGAAVAVGFFVVSNGGGSLKLWDNTAASGTVLMDTFTPDRLGFFPLSTGGTGIAASLGIYATITGTLSVNIVYDDPNLQ